MQRNRNQAPHSRRDEPPLSLLLFRYLWPFWLFEDASRGDLLARAAAYRHNRSMRVHLPGYLQRWAYGALTALAAASAFGSLSNTEAATAPPSLDIFAIIAAGWGIVFACSLCVLLVMAYIYLYLEHND